MRTFYLLLFLFIPFTVISQNKKLIGQIFDEKNHTPIPDARIYILNGPEDGSTNMDGEYELDLSIGNVFSLGKEIEIRIHHKKYGFSKHIYTISNKLIKDFYIRNNNTFGIFGSIKDNATDAPLEGFEISIVPDNPTIDKNLFNQQLTDRFGRFQFILNKNEVGNFEMFHYSIKDPTNCYKSKEELAKINQHLEIRLDNTGDCEEFSYKNFNRIQKEFVKLNRELEDLKKENEIISVFEIRLKISIPIKKDKRVGEVSIISKGSNFFGISKIRYDQIKNDKEFFHLNWNGEITGRDNRNNYEIISTFTNDDLKGKNISELSKLKYFIFTVNPFIRNLYSSSTIEKDKPFKLTITYIINGKEKYKYSAASNEVTINSIIDFSKKNNRQTILDYKLDQFIQNSSRQ